MFYLYYPCLICAKTIMSKPKVVVVQICAWVFLCKEQWLTWPLTWINLRFLSHVWSFSFCSLIWVLHRGNWGILKYSLALCSLTASLPLRRSISQPNCHSFLLLSSLQNCYPLMPTTKCSKCFTLLVLKVFYPSGSSAGLAMQLRHRKSQAEKM